ncbi:polysaccharide chain length determinant protein, PEP-CTERM locus subfamily [Tritonibacter multivorans]|uniref:Polysaccharide chain length determinant protein, PEP-CTERM locus subfamily n=1 Tax=Tritonibacter multivorans TaxID=928856 RepID=A0A0N7M0M3_9RHOB|nr:hypothetical protein [Tritonibacter multivorans]MDA7422758.1 lipopolysaccharide biosynthesis protein [Tritonibacter multivorans]CUH80865.1 polysaccharide chain length determinant protein, PEP-CTERM locus subfamily [Tritonibacter multivorans]SFD56870.1 Uncharacterized protein involved in exopolysaccharide biosynthesis [Tritonibacter multivorans]
MQIAFYWQLFLRRVPMLLFFTVIGAGVGVWLALTLPTAYKSEAVLVVESGQIPDELAASTVRTGEIEALQIIRQRILSRDVLLELANDLNIFPAGSDLGADNKVDSLRERIEIATRGGQVNRRLPRDATIVSVGFTANSATLSANTVNELVTLILQTNVEMRTSVARQTLEFFTQEVERFEAELAQLSAQILDFQEANLEALPDSLEFRRDRQLRLRERLADLEQQQVALQDRRIQLISLYESTGTTSVEGALRQPAIAAQSLRPAEQNLAQLRNEYASLAAVLSESNPRMALLRSQIDVAEQVVAALPPLGASTGGDSSTQDPQKTLYEIQLADLDTQIGYIDDQKEAARAQLSTITRSIEATPGNSVTLSALERQYEALQAQYNQAIASKSRAETGSMIESLSRGQRITVVEQAVPPDNPSSPNRPMVAMAGTAAGFGFALAIALLLELLNQKIRRPEDLSALEIEAFAVIPYMQTPGETTAIIIRRLVLTVVFFTLTVGGLWYIDQNVRPLIPLVEDLMSSIL